MELIKDKEIVTLCVRNEDDALLVIQDSSPWFATLLEFISTAIGGVTGAIVFKNLPSKVFYKGESKEVALRSLLTELNISPIGIKFFSTVTQYRAWPTHVYVGVVKKIEVAPLQKNLKVVWIKKKMSPREALNANFGLELSDLDIVNLVQSKS